MELEATFEGSLFHAMYISPLLRAWSCVTLVSIYPLGSTTSINIPKLLAGWMKAALKSAVSASPITFNPLTLKCSMLSSK